MHNKHLKPLGPEPIAFFFYCFILCMCVWCVYVCMYSCGCVHSKARGQLGFSLVTLLHSFYLFVYWFILIFMCMNVLSVCMYECHVCAWCLMVPERELSGPLALELQMVVICRVGWVLGNKPGLLQALLTPEILFSIQVPVHVVLWSQGLTEPRTY